MLTLPCMYVQAVGCLSVCSAASNHYVHLPVCPAANNPEMVGLIPHMRGQGVMDLEFESDGEW